MRRSIFRSSAAISTLWPAPTIALCDLQDRRGAAGPGRLEPESCAAIRPMACSTAPYCVGVWREVNRTPCAVTTLYATRTLAQHCPHHPRPLCILPWREAVSPRVALPWRPWHGERRWTAWTCREAPNAALLQFVPSGLLPLSRSTTSKTVVAPMARAARLEPDEGCATIRPMACSTAPYCLGVWRDARCTPCAVTTLSATPQPAQHCLHHPRPILYRAWRWAVSPRVALRSRPWH